MLPIPEMRFPHAGTPFCPYPAKGQSSRKAESGSSSSAIRSLARNSVPISGVHLPTVSPTGTLRNLSYLAAGLCPGVDECVYLRPGP
jgi:hypothetical protein